MLQFHRLLWVAMFLLSATLRLIAADVSATPLLEKYRAKMDFGTPNASIADIVTDNLGNDYLFLNNAVKVVFGTTNYTAKGSGSIVLKFNSKGELIWMQELGDKENYVAINEVSKDLNGNIAILSSGYFVLGKPLTLGAQTFSFKSDTKPQKFMALLNVSTMTWEKPQFIYIDYTDGKYVEQINLLLDEKGNSYLGGLFSSNWVIVNNDTVLKHNAAAGSDIFVAKFSADRKYLWSKVGKTEKSGTSLGHIRFCVDKSENVFLAGYVSYVTGKISLDGIVVKNDTISNGNDYSYSDIFLYKIDGLGNVKFGKTFLYRGNENPLFLKPYSNGDILMCGEYNSEMYFGNRKFPVPTGGGYNLSYNLFVSRLNGNSGNIVWMEPIDGNIYYSERQSRFQFDINENLYLSTRFSGATVNCYGKAYPKRNTHSTAANILIAKFNSIGVCKWANVMGASTTFRDNTIEHGSIFDFKVGAKLVFSVPRRNYSVNSDFAYGPSLQPETTYQGYWGNTVVVDTASGSVQSIASKFYQTFALKNATDFTAFESDFTDYYLTGVTNKSFTLKGTLRPSGSSISTLPASAYGTTYLLNAAENEKGNIVSQTRPDTAWNFTFTGIPEGSYIIQHTTSDSSYNNQYCNPLLSYPVVGWQSAKKYNVNANIENCTMHLHQTKHLAGTGSLTATLSTANHYNPMLQYFSNINCRLIAVKAPTPMANGVFWSYENNRYTFKFRNLPAGTYDVVFDFPFVTMVETITATVKEGEESLNNDYKCVGDKILKLGSNPIQNVSDNQSIRLYPNPAQNRIFISSNLAGNNTGEIISLQGKTVKRFTISGNASLDISDLNNGFYLVKIGTFTSRITVAK